IGDLNTPNTGSSTPTNPTLRGINITSTLANSNINLSYNTILLDATSAGANFGSAGVFATTSTTATSASLTMRNNIIVNLSTPAGTGLSVAYQRSSTTLTNYNTASNNNLFYAGTPGANNLIFFDGTNADQTLVDFKNRVSPADANSITENPTFLSVSGASADFLHINPAVATQIESGGANVAGITTDFDGNIRAGNAGYMGAGATPDIGADEGDFVALDLSGPAITYTPVPNLCSFGNIALNAVSITDATGIPLAGNLIPRVYYRKNAGSWFSQPGTYVSGSATNSVWNFTIVVSDLGGLVVGDVVQYYVIAQDIVVPTNIASNPGGVVATDVNNVTTHPATPNETEAVNTLSGTYTVGTGGDFPTLTAAVNAYNISCLGGPVVFSLTDANYPSETFPITINYNDFASATNTLTIRPAAGNGATITGSATALIKIDGADWVTLDGSNSGGTDRSLNLLNTSTSTSAAVWVASTNAPGNGATNIVVKNLNIEGGIGTTTNVFGIASKASSALTTGASDNDNLTIQNNAVAKVYTGISVTGTTAATAYDNLLITGNTIGSADPTKYIANRGIEISYANSPVVSDNSISNIITSSSNAATGIDVGINIIGGSVVRNNIITVYNTNSGGWNAYGIHFSSGTATTNVLAANNFISDIKTVNYLPTSSFNAFGIRISGGTNLKIYNNSIHQFGDVTVIGSGAGMSSNIYISSSAATGLEIRNNILSNVQSFATAGSFVYNIFISFSGYSFASIDHNDYYGQSSANTTYRVGYSGGTIFTTLPEWQGFTGQDANSVAVQPNFTSNTDLHLTSTNNQCLDGAGAVLAAVTDDFDGDSRDPLRPDIGADEFTNPNVTLTVAETSGAADNDGAVCFLDQATLTAAGGVSYSWSSNDNTPSIVVSPPATTTYTVTITHSNSCVDILQSTVTVTPLPTEFNVTGGGAFCAPGAGVPVGLSGSETGVNYQLQRDGVDAGSPLAGTGAALDFGNQTLAGSYTVIATNASTTCSAPMLGSAEVIPNQTPASFSMTGGGAFCDPGPGVPVGLSGSETGVDYQLQLNNVNLGAAVAGTGFALDFGSQNAAGAYTVVATYVIGGCTADMSGSAVVVANSSPVLSETHVEPTTCFAANGSIDLTVSGGTAPFAYNWFTSNGNGLQQGQQDQSNLTVGSYFVTVTDNNTCSATLLATLIGPGGCNACPVIGNLATTPAGICAGDNITLTASNLVDMGTTYGITFKYFGAPSATPYIGGTVIGTVDNSGLDNNGTTATITTSLATGGVYYLYAILDQLPIDPACRPSASYVLTVLSIPSVNPVSSQTVCAGSNTAPVNFSGPIPGTTYSWTNDNTSIGLAAAGTGNIPAFAAINNGTAPVTATITVTPSVNDPVAGTVCNGTPITFTITVNPVPTVNAVVNQTYCNGAAVPSVVFTSNVPGATFNWSRTAQSIGLIPTNGTGNVPAFTAANATNAPVTATFTATATYTNNGVPCTGPAIQFTITINPAPTVSATPTSQTVCNGATTTQISLSGAVAGTVYNWTNNTPSIGLAANGTGNIPSFTATNAGGTPITATITITPTYTNNGVFCSGTPITVTITVNPTAQVNQPANVNTCGGALTAVTFTTTTPGSTYTWTNTNTAIGLPASGTGNISFTAAIVATTTVGTITVTPNYTNNGVSCPGVARTFTILVDPLPTVNAVANQPAVCSGDATNAVTFTGSIPGTVFNWTNNNTNIGLAASGSGNIPSFIAQNPGTTIQTATITVTPVLVTGSGSCPGTPITFTYTVYPRPVVTLPASVTICQDQNAVLSATLGGGATGGTWSGGAGQF
ncbi:MAG: hypothetical protein JNJ90_05105, partial [Saprospiraceae bacterium]|nr:hypothetical protein [Saprospiraceae bacterium]